MATGTSDPAGKPKRGKRMTSNGISRKPGSIEKSDDVSPRHTPNSARESPALGAETGRHLSALPVLRARPRGAARCLCDQRIDHEAVAGADFERRLHLHVPAGRLLAELAQLLAERSRNRLLGGEAAGLVVGVALAQLHAGAHDREQEGVAEHLQEMIVDLVVEAGEAALVAPGILPRSSAEASGKMIRVQATSTRSWPVVTLLS